MSDTTADTRREEDAQLSAALLDWYDRHQRTLPWRVTPAARQAGARPDPYRIWLSEVMLQQTTVEAVKPFYSAFLERWPDVAALTAAELGDVMKVWAGLGYYSRARNLKACAELVAGRHGGRFPTTEAELRALPGIGAYTAAAIAAIAFDRPAAVIDGNVERVMARLMALEQPPRNAKRDIRARLETVLSRERPGDFAQAMMDLGATVCTPRRPRCLVCPLRRACLAAQRGEVDRFPLRAPKAEKPRRRGAAFVAIDEDGAVLVRRRPETGLLGGMTEVPTSNWSAGRDGEPGVAAAPFAAPWQHVGTVGHTFTHFSLELDIWLAEVAACPAPPEHRWSRPVDAEALPTVMRKAVALALDGHSGKQRRKRA